MADMQQQTKGAVHLSSDTFQKALDEAAANNTPLFVDFYADWCGPCQVAAPIIDKLADELAGKVVIAKLNVDENNDMAGKYGVMSIPTVLVFQKQGEEMKEVSRQIGFPGEDGYRAMLAKVMPGVASTQA